MVIVLFGEWDNPKDPERIQKYRDFSSKKGLAYWEKKVKEGVVKTVSSWSDNTGHIISWIVLEGSKEFSKIWDDEGYHSMMREFILLVDNFRSRMMRPAV